MNTTKKGLAAMLSLLLLCATAAAEFTCLGPNNQVVQGFCQIECQTDEIVYRLCSNSTSNSADGAAAFLMLHILVSRDENVTVSVTNRYGRPLEFQHWIEPQPQQQQQQQQDGRPNCSMEFDVLHVKIADNQRRWLNDEAVIRVETQRRIRYYSLFSAEASHTGQSRDWLLVLGYILETESPSRKGSRNSYCGLPDEIVRLAAIVSRPKPGSVEFADSDVAVHAIAGEKYFWNMRWKMASCPGLWCVFEVKQTASCAQWRASMTPRSEQLVFEFLLPRRYRDLYGARTPQYLTVVDFAQRYGREAAAPAIMSSAGRLARTSCAPLLTQQVGLSMTKIVVICLLAVSFEILVITGLAYWAVCRCRRSAYSAARSKVLIVCSTTNLLTQSRCQQKVTDSVKRLQSCGYSVIFQESLDARLLRESLAETRVFILLGEEFSAHETARGDNPDNKYNLELLTTAEKSRYTVVRGKNLIEQLTSYLDDLVTQRCPQRRQQLDNLAVEAAPETAALVSNEVVVND